MKINLPKKFVENNFKDFSILEKNFIYFAIAKFQEQQTGLSVFDIADFCNKFQIDIVKFCQEDIMPMIDSIGEKKYFFQVTDGKGEIIDIREKWISGIDCNKGIVTVYFSPTLAYFILFGN